MSASMMSEFDKMALYDESEDDFVVPSGYPEYVEPEPITFDDHFKGFVTIGHEGSYVTVQVSDGWFKIAEPEVNHRYREKLNKFVFDMGLPAMVEKKKCPGSINGWYVHPHMTRYMAQYFSISHARNVNFMVKLVLEKFNINVAPIMIVSSPVPSKIPAIGCGNQILVYQNNHSTSGIRKPGTYDYSIICVGIGNFASVKRHLSKYPSAKAIYRMTTKYRPLEARRSFIGHIRRGTWMNASFNPDYGYTHAQIMADIQKFADHHQT